MHRTGEKEMIESELWVGGEIGMHDKFVRILESTNRVGMKDLLNWLETTDFFTAPASANGHNNYKTGLLEHSLNVFLQLLKLKGDINRDEGESIIIVSLLHDICKANFYKPDFKNQKRVGPDGKDVLDIRNKPIWDRIPIFSIDDKFPLGHGEKSVIIIQKFMKLTDEEIAAIRWHMGGFDDSARSYEGGLALTKAMQKYPLITYLHAADLIACLPEDKNVIE